MFFYTSYIPQIENQTWLQTVSINWESVVNNTNNAVKYEADINNDWIIDISKTTQAIENPQNISKEKSSISWKINILEDNKIKKDEKEITKYTYAWNNAILEENFEQEKDKLKLEETKENIYSNTIDDILASIITKDWKTSIYYYTKNQLWSITAITDEKGKVLEEYKYDVFGKAYIRNGKSDRSQYN